MDLYLSVSKYRIVEYPEICLILGEHEDEVTECFYVRDLYKAIFRYEPFDRAIMIACQVGLEHVKEYIDKKYFLNKRFDLPVMVMKDKQGYYIDLTRNGDFIQKIRPIKKSDSLQEVLGLAELFSGLPLSLDGYWGWADKNVF